jgi:hypothetical protein
MNTNQVGHIRWEKKRPGYNGQSIDQLMATGWGVTLLDINAFRATLELET